MKLYKISLKELKQKARKSVRENESCLRSLKNKNSLYYRQVEALGKLHKQALEIYENAPKDIE